MLGDDGLRSSHSGQAMYLRGKSGSQSRSMSGNVFNIQVHESGEAQLRLPCRAHSMPCPVPQGVKFGGHA